MPRPHPPRRGRRCLAPALVAAAAAVAPTVAVAALLGTLWTGPGAGSRASFREASSRGGVSLRAQWDLQRFSKTVSFFRGSPWKLLLPPFLQSKDARARRARAQEAASEASELTLVDWGVSDGLTLQETWGQLDDVVMGGVSASRLSLEGAEGSQRLVFEGSTSRENNGGFCSFRSRVFSPPFNLSGYDGLAFKARCRDGLRYKVQLRDNTGWDSLGYSAGFDVPAGEEAEVKVPFSSLVANFRSQTQRGAPPVDRSSVYSIQFVLSAFEFDKAMNPRFKEGAFRLELGPLRAYRDAPR
mmetsp:Transcript_74509/g.197909  ORF Transcript_74509/g.197909 Transcript_74509/m.197909 type:complete len:299 (-) Transcript_74509:50-946(-)